MDGIFAPTGWLTQGIILVTGVIGQLYVARMNHRGFYYWAASNIILIIVCLQVGGYGMVMLYAYFLVMAIYSILHWTERQEQERKRRLRHDELLEIARAFVEFARAPEINGALDPSCHLAKAKSILLAEGVLKYDDVHPRHYLPDAIRMGDAISGARTACACGEI